MTVLSPHYPINKMELTIETMKQLNLFDDVQYKYFKNLNDEDKIKVEIEPLEPCNKQFTFELSGKKFKKVIAQKPLILPDEIIKIIKEYMGIYNLPGWSKIGKLSVDKIHGFYKEHYRRRLTNYKTNAHTSKVIMFRRILPSITYEKSVKLLELLPKPKEDVTIQNQSIFKVGDEVATYEYCGIIKKIGKRISIQKYTEEAGYDEDPMALKNQTHTKKIYKYNKSVLQKVCCISPDSISYVKRDGICYYSDKYNNSLKKPSYDVSENFEHRSRTIDYGY